MLFRQGWLLLTERLVKFVCSILTTWSYPFIIPFPVLSRVLLLPPWLLKLFHFGTSFKPVIPGSGKTSLAYVPFFEREYTYIAVYNQNFRFKYVMLRKSSNLWDSALAYVEQQNFSSLPHMVIVRITLVNS